MLSGNLEYTMSSLPNLTFSNSEATQHEVSLLFQKYALSNQKSGDIIAMLNDESAKFLSTGSRKMFQNIQLNTIHQEEFHTHKLPAVAKFSKFMWQLKHEIKHYREAKASAGNQAKATYVFIENLPKDPLQAEIQLLKLQWQKLEQFSIGNYANLTAIILYKLKLQVLLRWWHFNTENGFKVFQDTLKKA